MKTVREKFLTVVEAEKVTGVHYTVNHSGKMEGMQSLSTSCLCNEYCKNRSSNSELVCSHCYAQRQMKMYKNLNACLERNTKILTGRILKEAEIPIINASFFRFESFGDLINVTQVINYFHICKKNKHVHFALWTKNPFIIEKVVSNGEKKPRNLQIILSSMKINQPADGSKWSFVDKVFTVYSDECIEANNVQINCGSEPCLLCRKCYCSTKNKTINERLKIRRVKGENVA